MRDDPRVRTTLDLDDDVLQAAKEIAEQRGITAGRAVSDLIRKALEPAAAPVRLRNGVPLLSRRAGAPVMTMARVNELRDE
jgi:antitoxin component of RelBE/YafQ-DinJ toxin-antitoxin module